MFHNATLAMFTTSEKNIFIQQNLSPTIRSTRYIFHVMLLLLYSSILSYIIYKISFIRISTCFYSQICQSICIICLVFNDLLIINGLKHRIWCSFHQLCLHLLLMTIIASHLLPDVYQYIIQCYQHCNPTRLKLLIIFGFLSLFCVQLFISIKGLSISHNDFLNDVWDWPIFCRDRISSELFIFLLHLFDLICTVQSIRKPIMTDDNHSFSSINMSFHEKLCQLYSILLRLFYFTSTSILYKLFLPGQFTATFYSGILVIEFILKYLIINYYHSNIDYTNGMIDTGYLRLKNDDLSDDSRLLNNID